MLLLMLSLAVLVIADLFEQVTDYFVSVGESVGVPPWVRILFAILVGFGLSWWAVENLQDAVLYGLAASGAAGLLRLLGGMLGAVRIGFSGRSRR